MRSRLIDIYDRLYAAYGPQHWWPGDSPFEVIVGAILTQQVNWANVERAIAALMRAKLLTPTAIARAPHDQIAALIRPTVYYNEKAKKLKAFVEFLETYYQGDLTALLSLPAVTLREQLLTVRGIGEETADSIVLYAAGKLSFVVDAYTRRILTRLRVIAGKETYAQIRKLFMDNLPADVRLYNEYHALLVRHGKERCRRRAPLCDGCPLHELCPFPQQRRR